MKKAMKLTALLVSGGILCSAMPVLPAAAADEEVTMTAVITLNGDKITATGDNVTVDGTKVTISASGAYELKGTLDDGQIIVNVPDDKADPETVKLYLNGVKITGKTDAAILIENAEKTSVNLMDNTENYLYDGETYTNTTAVIYAKDDLTIKSAGELGNGYLRVEAAYQQGLHCNNDVKFTGGKIKFKTAVEDAVRGKTSVEIKGGEIDINAEGDGIKSTKGKVLISGGTIDIKSGKDAVQGETSLEISGGTLKANGDRGLTCANGTPNISGGTVLATATDAQCAAIAGTQAVIMASFASELLKDQAVTVSDSTDTVFSMTPDKKFSYAVISAPELTVGTAYKLAVAGQEALNAEGKADFTLEQITTLEGLTVPQSTKPFDGDINCNGETDVADAVLMARFIAEDSGITVTEEGMAKMDFNGDGHVTSQDSSILLCFLAGLPTA